MERINRLTSIVGPNDYGWLNVEDLFIVYLPNVINSLLPVTAGGPEDKTMNAIYEGLEKELADFIPDLPEDV